MEHKLGETDLRGAAPSGLPKPGQTVSSAEHFVDPADFRQSQGAELPDSEKSLVRDLVEVLLCDRVIVVMLTEMGTRGHVALDRARISRLLTTGVIRENLTNVG
jgi:hypothetical protein